jgi:hypothetical protein
MNMTLPYDEWKAQQDENAALHAEITCLQSQLDAMVVNNDSLRARIASLERNIIEADAQYNIDREPQDIETAELGLVVMAGYGREAMDKIEKMQAKLDALAPHLKTAIEAIEYAYREGTAYFITNAALLTALFTFRAYQGETPCP